MLAILLEVRAIEGNAVWIFGKAINLSDRSADKIDQTKIISYVEQIEDPINRLSYQRSKTDTDERFESQYVAQGFTQVHGEDYNEIF